MNKIIYTKMRMRYGRKNRRGRKPRKYRKRRGRKSRGRRSKKLRALKSSIYKDGKVLTTLYKTAIRVTSRPGACNYVVLDKDPQQVAFNNGAASVVKAPFVGDMTFYGYTDMLECMRNAYSQLWADERSQLAQPSVTNIFDTVAISTLAPGTDVANRPVTPQLVPFLPNYKSIIGKNYYQLYVKSAITGANCFVTLYKIKARHDIVMNSYYSQSRGDQTNPVELSTGLTSVALNSSVTSMNLVFNSVQNLHKAGWFLQFAQGPTLGIKEDPANTFVNMTVADMQNETWSSQEGTTLYDNKYFLQFFKIVKKYNAELMPGQKAKLSMKQKPKFFNPLRDFPAANNCIAKKGQVFFVLKLQGAWGHENNQGVLSNQNPTTPGPSSTWLPTETNSFYKGGRSRPNIGIMPAAVDVICMKKFKTISKKILKPIIRNIIKVPDYTDSSAVVWQDNTNPNPTMSDYFIDSAPSDYAATKASIN